MKFAAIGMLVLSGMAWAAPDLNDTFTALKTATEAKDADQVKKLAPQAAKEAKDLLSKPDTASDVTEFAKGNVEAMMASTKILASGLQEMGKGYVTESKSAMETLTEELKADYPCWCGSKNCRGTLLSSSIDEEEGAGKPKASKSKAAKPKAKRN